MYIQKVKFRHLGEIGDTVFQYNLQNGRYNELGEGPDNNFYKKNDYSLDI